MTVTVLGKGLYDLTFASRLIHVNRQTLGRWVNGYKYTYRGVTKSTRARWEGQHGEGSGILGFLDLIEARIIGEFRRRGVSWNSIAAASVEARRELRVSHPFATLKLMTNGRRIFLEVGQEVGDEKLIEIAHNQRVFEPFIRPYLIALDFGNDELANRWWPIGRDREVIVDPARSFGKPIMKRSGVPTAVLARAASVGESTERVARWYQVSEKEVRDAVYYERTLIAA